MNDIINTILFSNVINLFIVIAFFVWIFRKYNIIGMLAKKREEIAETLKTLNEEKNIKETQLKNTQEKVKNVDFETAKMVENGEQIAENICDRIIDEAEKEASNMQKKAHLTIQSERKLAANEVIQEITSSAFALAEAKISTAIDERLHKKYIDNFIDNLGNLHE